MKKMKRTKSKLTSDGVKNIRNSKLTTNSQKLKISKENDYNCYPKSSTDSDWVGRSTVAKFFPTEVSDDDDGEDNLQSTSPTRNNSSLNFRRNEFKKESVATGRREYASEWPTSNKVNIDPWSDGDWNAWGSNCDVRSENIIRHRPTHSERIKSDCFIPKLHGTAKMKTARRHNCNDEKDVTRRDHSTSRDFSTDSLPPPLSVISERHQDNIFTPVLPPEELCRFGEVYEANLLHNIHKYLEVDALHRVVYIGPEKGSIASQIEDHFCLVKGILSVYPGKIDYADIKENEKLLAFKIAHVGAEEFFAQAVGNHGYKDLPFDRIVIHDSVRYFNDIQVTFQHILKTLHQFGKILIIHRPGNLNTLPYFTSARQRLVEDDIPYMNIISSLQKIGADVEWDLVHIPIKIAAAKWLAMLKAKYPPQLEIMSNYEITCGIRELSEGPLKYLQGSDMELEDRLMFITTSLPTFDCAYPSVQRVGGASQVPYSGIADAKYHLPITEDLAHFLPASGKSQRKKNNPL